MEVGQLAVLDFSDGLAVELHVVGIASSSFSDDVKQRSRQAVQRVLDRAVGLDRPNALAIAVIGVMRDAGHGDDLVGVVPGVGPVAVHMDAAAGVVAEVASRACGLRLRGAARGRPGSALNPESFRRRGALHAIAGVIRLRWPGRWRGRWRRRLFRG